MNRILLSNIQRFSLHDGPGIRTTVFLKGCSLRCPWCANPENLESYPQEYIKDGIPGIYGKYYSQEELTEECLRDLIYYEGNIDDSERWCISSADQIEQLPGGVTFSGGEPLLQMPGLVPVITSLHEKNVHIAVETCLFVPEEYLSLGLENIDFFFVDIKILTPEYCKKAEHGNLDMFLANLRTLFSWKDAKGKGKPVVVRIPVIGSYTDDLVNRRLVKELLFQYRNHILKIELIKEHNLGESKYKSLNMVHEYHGVEDKLMETYKGELEELGILTEICKM